MRKKRERKIKQKRKKRKISRLIKKVRRKRRKVKLSLGRPKKIFLPEKLQLLIEKGKQRGFVTFSEILYSFPEVERDIKGLEKLYETLDREGIEIKESKEFLAPDELTKKEKKAPRVEVIIDPVQMYLKEIGSYSFLTAEGEKELAKKIEKGDKRQIKN